MVVGVVYQIINAREDDRHQCWNRLEDDRLCLQVLTEEMNECPLCRVPVVWKYSKTWTRLYGKANVAIKRLQSTPGDGFGQAFLVYAGETDSKSILHFAKPHDLKRWNDIVAVMPQGQIQEVVNRCRQKTKGYGLIQHVLNSCDKLIREGGIEQPQVDPFAGMEVQTID